MKTFLTLMDVFRTEFNCQKMPRAEFIKFKSHLSQSQPSVNFLLRNFRCDGRTWSNSICRPLRLESERISWEKIKHVKI